MATMTHDKLSRIINSVISDARAFKGIMDRNELVKALDTIRTLNDDVRGEIMNILEHRSVYIEIMDTGIVFYIKRLGKTVYSVQLRAAGKYYPDTMFVTRDNKILYNDRSGVQTEPTDQPIQPDLFPYSEQRVQH